MTFIEELEQHATTVDAETAALLQKAAQALREAAAFDLEHSPRLVTETP